MSFQAIAWITSKFLLDETSEFLGHFNNVEFKSLIDKLIPKNIGINFINTRMQNVGVATCGNLRIVVFNQCWRIYPIYSV